MVPGISPDEAMSRLQKSTKLYELVERKYERYAGGEELFALKKTEYPALIKTKKELDNLNKLYSLYADVTDVVESWYQILWSDAESQIETMTEKLDEHLLQILGDRKIDCGVDMLSRISPTEGVLKGEAILIFLHMYQLHNI